jgi:hypothetical protein
MKLNLSNRLFRLSLTKIAVAYALLKRKREPKAEAIEQVRIPATAGIAR